MKMILCTLCAAIALIVLVAQPAAQEPVADKTEETEGLRETEGAQETEEAEETESGLPPEELLPSPDDLPGWRYDGEVLSYGPEDLWEYINGQAENFLLYDFRTVAVRHYIGADGLEIKVEVYEHGSPLMAWGIYTQFRSPGAAVLDIGVEGFGDGSSLLFWKGPYYVRIQGYDEGEANEAAVRLFAGLVEGAIEHEGGNPAEISVFPADGLIGGSLTYVTEGALGNGRLPEAFVAEYRRGEEEGKIYLFPLDHEEDAGVLLDWYAEEIGAELREVKTAGITYEAGTGEAPYRGRVLAFRVGRWIGIIAGFSAERGVAEGLAAETAALIWGFDAG